tara:strand:+ start:1470 stop:1658 length:189 start_codon:yes stop_codon:yes gene_type:complete
MSSTRQSTINDPELLRQFEAFTNALNHADRTDFKYMWKLKRDDVVRRAKQKEKIDNALAIRT